MSAKNERDPLKITWNGFDGFRCPFCGQDFLDDGTAPADVRMADHLWNIHPVPIKFAKVVDESVAPTPEKEG